MVGTWDDQKATNVTTEGLVADGLAGVLDGVGDHPRSNLHQSQHTTQKPQSQF